MPARVRKLVGSLGVLAFMLLYAIAVAAIADHLPDLWLVKLVFFAVAGIAWGGPIIPLITWMNRGK